MAYNVRVIQKHDIETNWDKALNFIPEQGELIIYDPDTVYNYPRLKIGDGVTVAKNLPFILDTINKIGTLPNIDNNGVLVWEAFNLAEVEF